MSVLQASWRKIRQPWSDQKYSSLLKHDDVLFEVRSRPARGHLLKFIISALLVILLFCGLYGRSDPTWNLPADQSPPRVTDDEPRNELAFLSQGSESDPWYDIASGNKKLSIIAFASDSGPALCKVMMSAMAMGYPMPVIINWGVHMNSYFPQYIRKQGNVGSHQLKVTGALSYLDEISHSSTPEKDRLDKDDLVLMVDAYDMWFQTPPEVLVRRYHEANRLADERNRKLWPGEKEDMPMKQTIVVSSQKKCFPMPGSAYDLKCHELPEGPQRTDLYGPNTDKDEKATMFHDNRPKYINSGAIMGTVGDLKRYLRATKTRMDHKVATTKKDLASDQGMFGEVFGEQEVYRTWLRKKASENQGAAKPDDLFMHRDFEYGVGLDYKQDICIATVFEEFDGEIVALSNKTFIESRSEELGIIPTRMKSLPEDLTSSQVPLAAIGLSPLPKWEDLKLYMDFWSTSVPAMVHHNAHAGGLKNRNTIWWDRPWYFPYLREMVNARSVTGPLKSVGTVKSREGTDVTYFPVKADEENRLPRIFKAGDAVNGLDTIDWEDLCFNRQQDGPHWSVEVFRDGRGGMQGQGVDP